MSLRNLIFTAGILLLLILLGFLVCIATEEPGWSRIETDRNDSFEMEEDGVYILEPWNKTDMPSYVQKFEEAVSMFDDEDIDDQGAYLVVIDISEQKEYLFDSEGELEEVYKVSTGSDFVNVPADTSHGEVDEDPRPEYQDHSMGPSIWRVVSKVESGLAPLYGPRLMMMDKLVSGRWIKTNVALHGTSTPEILGTPESLGCVYHSNVDIIALYDLIEVGTYVVAIR